MSDAEKLSSVKEFAAAWKVEQRTVYRWIARGIVDFDRSPSGRVVIPGQLPKRRRGVAIIHSSSETETN